MAHKLMEKLLELGSKLESPPTTKDSLIKLLKQGVTCLSELDQSLPKPLLESMQPFLNAIVKQEILKHQDREVKLLVAACFCEITRITAPEAPFSDDILKDIFQLIVSTFSGLSDINGPSFGRRVVILETLARYRSCVVMLDLECDDLVNEMFSTFLSVARDEHPENVLKTMQTIMVVILEESEDIRQDLVLIILSVLGRNRKDVAMAARDLALKVIEHCSGKLEPGIKHFLISSMSGEQSPSNCQIDYHEIIYDIYRCAPQILSGVVPYLTGELLTDQLEIRLKAVGLVGDIFSLTGSSIPESFQPIFVEFLKRLTDRFVEVRMCVLEHAKNCLLSCPSRVEAPQIISALCDRLLDYDENVRKQVVSVLCDVACHTSSLAEVETVKLVAERLRDKSLLVKKYTMQRLSEIYRIRSMNYSHGSREAKEFTWIAGKILRCFYDKDFRSDVVESILCDSLFPNEFSTRDKVKNWFRVFLDFDKVEVKALEKILEQKQRLQQEMRKYLSLRQMYQDNDVNDLQKKVTFCFRVMSRCFTDSAKAEESFHILDQFKDANIWKLVTSLLDPNFGSSQASNFRDELLRIVGEKHRLYEFLSILSLKCSYILFNKEHVKEILLEAATQRSAGFTLLNMSCMNILVILSRFSPLLLCGIEEDLMHLLEDDDEITKEGALHILANAGASIREQLGGSSRSPDLILEKISVEGSRKQAKYAVYALASIAKDDGLMSLSVLYKRLVDMLEEKSHLPAVLQSLGCIAQTAMPVFETRESEIKQFVNGILEQSDLSEDKVNESWEDRSELCSLKIFSIKTLVKSYLPVKDAHLRMGIDDLMEILKNILSFGEISSNVKSSLVDKAHLRLAAAKSVLRLSRQWDQRIPIDLFYLTLSISEDIFPQVKKLFLDKVHQYLKDRLLDPKYACAFLLGMGPEQTDIQEHKSYLSDIILMYQQGKARQLSTQSDENSPVAYPEYILAYFVHAVAHQSSFPNMEECKDVKSFEPIYRKLHVFLSILLHGEEEGNLEASTSRNKEIADIVNSIFLGIKLSEDALDAAKSKNSYAVCDLGLSICKRLAINQDYHLVSGASVLLPSALYKLLERKEGNDSPIIEQQTWLAEEGVIAHFESLKLEANGNVNPEANNDEVMTDDEIEANELPLGEMLKMLKAKGARSKKEVKDEAELGNAKNENDVDILKVVKEINSDNKFESSNGHEYVSLNNADKNHKKRKLHTSEPASAPAAKRHQSFSEEVSSFESSNGEDEHTDSGSGGKYSQDYVIEPTESDFLVSCIQNSAKHKNKHAGRDHTEGHKGTTGTDKKNIVKNSKYKFGKIKKRQSIAGLEKCMAKDAGVPTMDLIGCRIKVWWPMDKQFYEGIIKSFDSQKKKHVILYDDGDVEVLRLDKERWEVVDRVQNRKQLSSSSKEPKTVVQSPETRKKRTPRKNFLARQKGMLKSKLQPSAAFNSNAYMNSEGEQNRSPEQSLTNGDQSEEDDKSVSDGGKDMKSILADVVDHASSDDETHRETGKVYWKDAGEALSDSEGGRADDASSHSNQDKSNYTSSANTEFSDNEPLCAWKHKVGKFVQGK